jgi:sialate O-acetylesterase
MKSRSASASLALVGLFSLLAACGARADVRLPAIFSDHMVLQQDEACAVWGWADPGEEVTVTIAGQSKSTKAGNDGRWLVRLGKLKVGGPHTLTVKGKNSLVVSDVLVGEVWLGSGQSNMAMTVNRAKDYEQEQAAAKLPQLRMFTVERNPQPKPQADCKGRWVVCAPDTVGAFSATAYFFGRRLHQELKVPVGLINSSYGGTAVEAWTSLEAQSKLPEYKTIAEPWEKLTALPYDEAKALAAYDRQLAAHKEAVKKAKAAGKQTPRPPVRPVDPRLNQNHPANLFNGMIAPLIPYTIRGAVWYQGESNAGKPFAHLYGLQLATMIKDWRARWGDEFPFAWVQLPDYRAPQKDPVENSGWTTVREEMLKTLKLPRTGMAITLGLGEANDIHPKNKQDVGVRLAMWALAEVYGKKGVASSGPLLAGHKVRGSEVWLSFKHTDGGLKVPGGDLKGFAIAGEDRRWVRATARVEGDKVVVFSPAVKQPVAVRYAWADNPEFSLFNGAGLPAAPFRTDDWK